MIRIRMMRKAVALESAGSCHHRHGPACVGAGNRTTENGAAARTDSRLRVSHDTPGGQYRAGLYQARIPILCDITAVL